MTLDITASDFFCGAGGSSTGLVAAGVRVANAANHWPLAIETHNTNHPTTEHYCADLQQSHPSMFPRTTIAWFSPSCTNHSLAKGKKRKNLNQLDLWGETGIDPTEERSRATMREVVEFSAYHHYEIVIVENVVDIRYWQHYDQWLEEMTKLGYDHKACYLNAMFFGVPQSRDRIYVVFWKHGNHTPDLDFHPYAFCIDHGVVGARQYWKKIPSWGRYGKRRQYVYCCPSCGRIVEPFTLPASDVIDWSIPSPRIGDRKRELKPKTIKRILEGLKKFAPEAAVVDTMNPGDGHVHPVDNPLATQTTRQTLGLVDPLLISYYSQEAPARSVNEPMYTVAGRNTPRLLIPPFLMGYYGRDDAQSRIEAPIPTITGDPRFALVSPFISAQHSNAVNKSVDEPIPAQLGVNHHALVTPFMIVLKNSHSKDGKYTLPPLSMNDPLTTVVGSASQHALIMAYYGNQPTFAEVSEPMPAATTVLRHALIKPEDMIDDCGFRMLEPEELKRGMSFPNDYVILGNKRDQVRQVGNAVACRMAFALVERCVQSLAS